MTSVPRIVLGLDGSTGAAAALEWCVEHAPAFGAEVIAVFALNPMTSVIPAPVLPVEAPQWEEQVYAQMVDELSEWCRPLRDAALPVRECVARGTPAEVLQRIADEENALMIVVGRRGRGGITEMFLGSVPHDLTHRATRPVLVVPGS